jgi:hypothetical protein
MSNSQKYSVYPLRVEILELFLKENEYAPTAIEQDFITWEKDDRAIRIPKEAVLTENQVKEVLSAAKLKISDFNWFLLHHGSDFDELLKRSNIKK